MKDRKIPKCEYNPKHKLKFIKCNCGYCDCCGDVCDCDVPYVGSWFCNACYKREEKERKAELERTCNIVVRITPDMTVKEGKLIQAVFPPVCQMLPHGGKKLKQGQRATLNREGYLESHKNGQFLIL